MNSEERRIPVQADRLLVESLSRLSRFAAREFTRQWFEIRGSWEKADWDDRIVATIVYEEKKLKRLAENR